MNLRTPTATPASPATKAPRKRAAVKPPAPEPDTYTEADLLEPHMPEWERGGYTPGILLCRCSHGLPWHAPKTRKKPCERERCVCVMWRPDPASQGVDLRAQNGRSSS